MGRRWTPKQVRRPTQERTMPHQLMPAQLPHPNLYRLLTTILGYGEIFRMVQPFLHGIKLGLPIHTPRGGSLHLDITSGSCLMDILTLVGRIQCTDNNNNCPDFLLILMHVWARLVSIFQFYRTYPFMKATVITECWQLSPYLS